MRSARSHTRQLPLAAALLLLAATTTTVLDGTSASLPPLPAWKPSSTTPDRASNMQNPQQQQAERHDVLVIGAGVAGLAAARALADAAPSLNVLVLEARPVSGGRIRTVQSVRGFPLDLGAAWIHGGKNPSHPITVLAQKHGLPMKTDPGDTVFLSGGKDVTASVPVDSLYSKFYKWMENELEDTDQRSLAQLYDAYVQDKDLSLASQQYLRAGIQSNVEQEFAANMSQLSARLFDQDSSIKGSDTILVNGYDSIIQVLLRGSNSSSGHNSSNATALAVRYNQQVVSVDYSNSTIKVTTDQGNLFNASYVISSLPLGIMQANKVAWKPALPPAKVKAMYSLNMGTMDKVVLVFGSNFWDAKGKDKVSWIESLTASVPSSASSSWGPWYEWFSLAATFPRNVLVGFNVADTALKVEAQSDADTLKDALAALAAMFPTVTIPQPLEVYITRWSQDNFTLGSYSSVRPNASSDVYDTMAKPIGNRLFFAGEATHRQYPGTVHGAYLSGQREAARVLQAIKR